MLTAQRGLEKHLQNPQKQAPPFYKTKICSTQTQTQKIRTPSNTATYRSIAAIWVKKLFNNNPY